MSGDYLALFTADWHIRDTIPIARKKEEYLQAQWSKINFVLQLAKNEDIPVFIAGDIGNIPEWSNELLVKTIRFFKEADVEIICIPGQHDLPNHNLDLIGSSGVGVLAAGHIVNLIRDREIIYLNKDKEVRIGLFPYSKSLPLNNFLGKADFKIAMVHELVVEKMYDFGNEINNFPLAGNLLEKYPMYNLIVSGDNHKSFMVKNKEGRIWLNCGSLMRMTSAQVNHKPKVYLLGRDYKIHVVPIPIEQGVVSREHIEKNNLVDDSMNTFISGIEEDYEIGMSFEKNLESFFSENEIGIEVRNKVWSAVGVVPKKQL